MAHNKINLVKLKVRKRKTNLVKSLVKIKLLKLTIYLVKLYVALPWKTEEQKRLIISLKKCLHYC